MINIEGRKIPNTLAEIVAPQRTALLLWDMEHAIAPNAFNYNEILPRLKDLSALARGSVFSLRPPCLCGEHTES